MKTVVHINQHNIKANSKGADLPVITVKTYKSNTYAKGLILRDQAGQEIGRLIYSPDKPLSCGGKVWLQFNDEVISVEASDDLLV